MSDTILALTNDQARDITQRLVDFNDVSVPFTQAPPFLYLNYGIRNDAGELIAGIVALLYCWKCLSIEVLWTDRQARRLGLGSLLLEKAESQARRNGARMAHLDTFDFQARQFYEKRGYELFGLLEECPPGHTRFYMKKTL